MGPFGDGAYVEHVIYVGCCPSGTVNQRICHLDVFSDHFEAQIIIMTSRETSDAWSFTRPRI